MLHKFSRRVHREWDAIVERLDWGSDKPVTVATYAGFGRKDYLYLTGRVLRDKALKYAERDGVLQNVVNNFKRFNSREIPGAEVSVEWRGHRVERTTDQEGYFKVAMDWPAAEPGEEDPKLWTEARVTVHSVPTDLDMKDYVTNAPVVLPGAAEFGVISDIDDTVLQTDVTSKLKLRTMWHTIFKNAGNRFAFGGASDFYQALSLGPDEKGFNPVFYLSNSPWNLYDLLSDFLSINHFPRGPILLRDFGLPYEEKPEDYRGHKTEKLRYILGAYPDLSFVLLGDSGEADTNIYLAAAREYPGRIKQIYIRDVQHERRAQRIEALIEENSDIPVKLIGTYEEAWEHASSRGLTAGPESV